METMQVCFKNFRIFKTRQYAFGWGFLYCRKILDCISIFMFNVLNTTDLQNENLCMCETRSSICTDCKTKNLSSRGQFLGFNVKLHMSRFGIRGLP